MADVTAELNRMKDDCANFTRLLKEDESIIRNNMKEILHNVEVRYCEQTKSLEEQMRQEHERIG